MGRRGSSSKKGEMAEQPKAPNPVRRSLRVQNRATPIRNHNIQWVHEEFDFDLQIDSEEEDEQPFLEEPLNGPNLEEPSNGPAFAGRNMEDIIDYAIRLLVKLNSKAKRRSSGNPDFSYKSLYIESQKKIEALKNENCELSMKLEVALAKYEGFKKGTGALSEELEKMKDAILVSKATEDVLSPPNIAQNLRSAAKRKKQSSRTSKKYD